MQKYIPLNSEDINGLLAYVETNNTDIVSESFGQPVFLVFLRHFGCTFCREALSDLSTVQNNIKDLGIKIVFVHMAESKTADAFFADYNLIGYDHISDPECRLYSHFGLVKGSFRQLLGLRTWMRGFKAGFVEGHGHGFMFIGDGDQMPGLFMLHKGEVIESYIHQYASDRPNYERFIKVCQI